MAIYYILHYLYITYFNEYMVAKNAINFHWTFAFLACEGLRKIGENRCLQIRETVGENSIFYAEQSKLSFYQIRTLLALLA